MNPSNCSRRFPKCSRQESCGEPAPRVPELMSEDGVGRYTPGGEQRALSCGVRASRHVASSLIRLAAAIVALSLLLNEAQVRWAGPTATAHLRRFNLEISNFFPYKWVQIRYCQHFTYFNVVILFIRQLNDYSQFTTSSKWTIVTFIFISNNIVDSLIVFE